MILDKMASSLIRPIRDLRVKEVRKILFPYPSRSPVSYLKGDLMISLPSLVPVPEVVDETLDLIRDMTYAIVEYERYHRPVSIFTRILQEATLKAARVGHLVMVDVMLHSGGNLMSIYDQLMELTSDVEGLEEIVSKYFPGIWDSVESKNYDDLRRLINYWTSIDIEWKGKTIQKLANETNDLTIERLISGSLYTLKLIHAMFGGHVKAMEELLEHHRQDIKLDFKHLGDDGPPIIHYAIELGNVDMVKLLIRHGCKIHNLMSSPTNPDVQVPVIYSAITNPSIEEKMMSALLSVDGADGDDDDDGRQIRQDILYHLTIDGENLLEVALRNGLNLPSFRVLMVAGGCRLVSDRNAHGLTIRDLAHQLNKKDFVDAVDSYVIDCVQHPEIHPHQRQILALFGYDLSMLTFSESPIDDFYSMYGDYQSQIKKLVKAIEDDDLMTFINLSRYTKCNLFEPLLTWEGRSDVLPLLHRAVIFNRPKIVAHILSEKPAGYSIDGLFDHMRRTAFHYANGAGELSQIVTILRESGCSDHIQDRNGKDPLDFKLVQDQPLMSKLLSRLRFGDFDIPEPDPWKTKKVQKLSMIMKMKRRPDGYQKVNQNDEVTDLLSDLDIDEDEDDDDEEEEAGNNTEYGCSIS